MKVPAHILPIIIYSQFAGTSLWFAVNAVIGDLQASMNVDISHTGIITSATQLGFIAGTLIFSLLALSDRYSSRKLFFVSSLLGAFTNLLIYVAAYDLFSLLVLRFSTGFFLTGIYPIGMKIAAGWFKKGLGNAIGLLVGALVLGTAFPHLLKSIGGSFPWEQVIIYVSVISVSGGFLIYFFVPDGPFITSGNRFLLKEIFTVFRFKEFRSAALGYFGHMWELYTFWAFVPILLLYYTNLHLVELNIFFWSFVVIGSGSIGCIGGGIISRFKGSPAVAFTQLSLSGICCLICPLFFFVSPPIFLSFLIFWGIFVVGDSPQYSAMAALAAPKEFIGTGLTLMVSIGFAITIVSLWFVNQFINLLEIPYLMMLLAPGPVMGLISMRNLFREKTLVLPVK